VALLKYRPNQALLAGATLASALTFATSAQAARGPSVTVRIEGAKRSLLAPKAVSLPSGFITKGGTPHGACPGSSAAGALDAATRGRWTGKWYASVSGIFVTSILGEKPPATADYWEVFRNNVPTQLGVCALKLRRGDQLLFADSNGGQNPTAVKAPKTVRAGRRFTVTVVYYDTKGKPKALFDARLSAGGHTYTSNRRGKVTLKATRAGRLTLSATRRGFIRSAPAPIKVT
jgi:hypothetical protein